MANVFEEIEIINELINHYQKEIENITLYYSELVQTSFENDIVYQNQEICLEYMEFQKYCKLTANILKEICHKIKKELETKKQTIQHLKYIREHKISKLLSLASSIPIKENILISDGIHINLNPKIVLSIEETNILMEYLDAKYWNEEFNFYDFVHESKGLN